MSEPGSKPRLLTAAGMDLIVNSFSFLCLTALAATGLGVLEDLQDGQSFLGVPRDRWEETHERLGMLMLAIIAYHLVRHRRWLFSVAQGKLLGDGAGRKRAVLGICLAALAVAAFVAINLLAG